MLYIGKDKSTLTVGEWREAEFFLSWYCPDRDSKPSDFDIAFSASSLISEMFAMLRNDKDDLEEELPSLKNFNESEIQVLDDFFGRDLAMVDNVSKPEKYIDTGEELSITNIDERMVKIISNLRDMCSKEHNEPLSNIFVIKGSPARGIVSAFHSKNKTGNEIRSYYFHSPVFNENGREIDHEEMATILVEFLRSDSVKPPAKYLRANPYDLIQKLEIIPRE